MQNKKDEVSYLPKKAEENYLMAQESLKKECFDVAVSRFYYYVFQNLVFFLENKGLLEEEHEETFHLFVIKQFFNFARTECDFENFSRSLAKLWIIKDRRVDSDYKADKKIENQNDFELIFMNDFNDLKKTLNKLNFL